MRVIVATLIFDSCIIETTKQYAAIGAPRFIVLQALADESNQLVLLWTRGATIFRIQVENTPGIILTKQWHGIKSLIGWPKTSPN